MPDWEQILAHDGPVAWRAAYRLLGRRADADECLQEAVLGALEIARRREAVRSWRALLLRLAAARAVDRLRARKRRAAREQAAARGGAGPSPEQAAEEAELIERLREALGRIPTRQAEVFVLGALEGWSYAEIADGLAIPIDTVGVLLHRARGRLRRLLADFAPAHRGPRQESP
jgi:RNA polymerase sigma-70 factor (ECF subfamily)